MIHANSHESVAAKRFVGTIFNGSKYARTDYLGHDQSDRDSPQALLVEQFPESFIPPHFHGIDQFQVVVDGSGRLGKHDLTAVSVHFTKGYTGYGPVVASDEEALIYFTLRAQSEPGAFFLPEAKDKQRAGPKRNLTVPVDENQAAAGALVDVIPLEQGGLGAWQTKLDPGGTIAGPDPMSGGGQYHLVLGGQLRYDDDVYGERSCIFVEPPESSLAIEAGPDGLSLLIVQFPFWEKGTAQNIPEF